MRHCENETPVSAAKALARVRVLTPETTIAAEPQRIVALGDGSADVVADLGRTPVGIAAGFDGANADGVLPWYAEHFDPAETTLVDVFDGIPFEQLAALDPDVILAPYSGFSAEEYETLSRIAPTVPHPDEPWQTPWPVQTEMIGRALGRPAEAAQLVADVEAHLAALAAAHPELAGVTYSYLYLGTGVASVYLPGDARAELVEALGPRPSPGVEALAAGTDGFFAELSLERTPDLEADVLIVEQPEDGAALSSSPLLQALPAVQRGAVVTYGREDDALLDAMIPTVLSIPWAADRLAADLGAAVAR